MKQVSLTRSLEWKMVVSNTDLALLILINNLKSNIDCTDDL